MEKIKATWSWLNGKKTTIGAIVAFIAGGLFTIGVIDQHTFDLIIEWNMILLGVGLAHKVVKGV